MRKSLIVFASLAALMALPAVAQEAATGAATGAAAGAAVGGPVGAVVGGAVGGTVGAASEANRRQQEVTGSTTVIETRPAPSVRESTCVTDSAGNQRCREVVR